MSVHISAEKGEIAETVLLPGDPLRAKWIAETYLQDFKCYNEVRNMLGYTGFYNGRRISVQGTGMGVPSICIYAHELINDYGVKNLIRVGSAGSYQKNIELRDIVIAMAASSNSGMNASRFNGAYFAPTASFQLFQQAVELARKKKIEVKAGNVLTSDIFYEENAADFQKWADYGILCVEMESSGLYTLAAKFGVQALSLLTISDSLVTGEKTSTQDRENTFKEMVEIALEMG